MPPATENNPADFMDEDNEGPTNEPAYAKLSGHLSNAAHGTGANMEVDSETDCGDAIRALHLGDDETNSGENHAKPRTADLQDNAAEIMGNTARNVSMSRKDNNPSGLSSSPAQSPESLSFSLQRKSERKVCCRG